MIFYISRGEQEVGSLRNWLWVSRYTKTLSDLISLGFVQL